MFELLAQALLSSCDSEETLRLKRKCEMKRWRGDGDGGWKSELCKGDVWLRHWRLLSTGRPHWSQNTPLATGPAPCPKTEMLSCPCLTTCTYTHTHMNGLTSMVKQYTHTEHVLFPLHQNLIGPVIPLTPPRGNKYKTWINLVLSDL